MNSYKCPKCGIITRSGQTSCPSCNADFPEEQPAISSPPKSSSMFSRIAAAVKAPSIKAEQRSQFTDILRRALRDGVLDQQEINSIDAFSANTELKSIELQSLKTIVFNELVGAYLADRRITNSEKQSILSVGQALEIDQGEMRRIDEKIQFYWYLDYIETCPFEMLPASGNPDVVLRRGEVQYSAIPGQMLEERVVSRRTVGASHGVSIRLMKGVSYRVGQSRGEMISESGIVPVSVGDFVITNQRLIFSGDRKSFNTTYDKILDYELFSDGIRLSTTNKQKPTTLQFYSRESAEATGIYISRVLNQL